jgi:uncharacterized protein YjbI with pentapeptide repeats
MANEEHLARLKQGVEAWNRWRKAYPKTRPNLVRAHLAEADLCEANLYEANLFRADLHEADLTRAVLVDADLTEAKLHEANLSQALLNGADLYAADLYRADLAEADLTGANLTGANLAVAYLGFAALPGAHLTGAVLDGANLSEAALPGAHLVEAALMGANLTRADLTGADLSGADLTAAHLENTILEKANLTGCSVYGVSVWNVNLTGAQQSDLVITQRDEPVITVDNLEVAQFIYLLLHNEKIREVIDTIGTKGVLILGRFAAERKAVLDALRMALRQRGFLPIVFDFEKPTQRDFTETIRILAGLSLFVIADITNPRSAPLELQATVPDYMIPFVPIIAEGEEPFAMFVDLQRQFDSVLEVLTYDSIDHLLTGLEDAVIAPALQKHEELVQRRARAVGTRHIQQYLPPGDAHP